MKTNKLSEIVGQLEVEPIVNTAMSLIEVLAISIFIMFVGYIMGLYGGALFWFLRKK